MFRLVGSTPRHEEGPLSLRSGGANEPTFSSAVNHIGPRISSLGRGTSAKELGRATRRVLGTSAEPCIVARSSCVYIMPDQYIVRVVGAIGLAVFASTPAFAADARGMTCAEFAAFAQEVAQQKAEGLALTDVVRRLRRSFGRKDADTEHQLEKIVRAIYGMPAFSTVSPEQVGSAYQSACEHG
jgi:hypothetical protein